MLSEEMADNTGFKDCFAGGGTFFHDDSLGCGFVDTTIKGRDDLRSHRRTMRGQGALPRAASKVENERFHMVFAVCGVDANRCHCQVLLRP